MNRRRFLHALMISGGAALVTRNLGSAENSPRRTGRFLLSEQGCGRATGYAEATKIVTLDGRTHVVWLDSPPEGFRARVRTLDRGTGEWSKTHTLGAAHDNHGGPALTVDGRGFLHVVYGPHHHPFCYRRSKRPNDASEWEPEIEFGERCTYPTLICGPDDTLYLTCRRSFSDRPWQMELWTKPADQSWEGPIPIARARFPGYAHFQESLAWGPDHRSLHLCCRFHEKTDQEAYGRIQTVGYMRSDDFGHSWHRGDGEPISGPATADDVDVLASGGVDAGRVLRAGAMAVDPEGIPHLVYSVREGDRSRSFLTRLSARGAKTRWERIGLNQRLPEEWAGWDLLMPGGLTFNRKGQLWITATVQPPEVADNHWGHPASELGRLVSMADKSGFAFRPASPTDPETAHWLPNIERPTGHNEIPDRPGLLYTGGPAGENNTDLLSNDVFWLG